MLILVGIVSIIFGLTLAVAIGINMIKNANSYTILHSAAVTDAIGSSFILLGSSFILFSIGHIMIGLKILLLIAMIYIFNPITAYIFAKILYFYDEEKIENQS